MIGRPEASWRGLLGVGAIVALIGGAAFATGGLPGRSEGERSVAVAMAEPDQAVERATDPTTAAATAEDGPPAAPAETPASAVTESEPEQGRRILISTKARRLWLVHGRDTLFHAPVAIGMAQNFEYQGRRYRFETPVGRRTVIGKQKDPLWTVPEWHYFEKATKQGLEAVKLEEGSSILLGDSTLLVVKDGEVGRINHFGYFHAWTPGSEIIFDGKIFIPPLNSPQRRVPDALGPYKLDMGDGYLIHGTHVYNEETIGEAVSHGCVRMRNNDLVTLYPMVPRGTPVHIF